MKIAILTDKTRTADLPGEEGHREDLQKKRTIADIFKVLSNKYECKVLEADEDMIETLREEKVDLVFNMCNGTRGKTRLAQIPALLEFAGIPYTGSSILGHALAINKEYACKMFKESGISTPDFVTVHNNEELSNLSERDIKFPAIVKPSDEGSGRGIHQDSLVYDMDSLKEKVKEELKVYNPPIMVTEFIDGREFTVGIIENGDDMKVLPILEINFQQLPDGFAKFYSFEVKSKYEAETIFECPATIQGELREKIRCTAKRAYNALNMKDYARIDIRVKDNTPYVLEINSLPGLLKDYSDITKMAKASGLGYDGLILNIVESALSRYKESPPRRWQTV